MYVHSTSVIYQQENHEHITACANDPLMICVYTEMMKKRDDLQTNNFKVYDNFRIKI